MAKPEWCESSKCPYSRGSDHCEINEWILRGWSSTRKETREIRKTLHQKYDIMAQEDPKALIQECVEKSFDKR